MLAIFSKEEGIKKVDKPKKKKKGPTLKGILVEFLRNAQQLLAVLALELRPAQRLEPVQRPDRRVHPRPLDERQVLHLRGQVLVGVVVEQRREDGRNVAEAHLHAHNHDAPDKRHVLGHAVLEADRLERERKARRHQRVGLFVAGIGPGRLGQPLLDGLDGLDAVVHGCRDERAVLVHELRRREAEDGVHQELVVVRDTGDLVRPDLLLLQGMVRVALRQEMLEEAHVL